MDHAGFVALQRGIVRGWRVLTRSKGWFVGVAGVTASLTVVQLLLVTFAGTRMATLSVFDWGAVHIEVAHGTSDQRVQEIYAGLRSLQSVSNVAFVTGERMLEEEKARDASLAEFLDRYDMGNPFSDAFIVVPRGTAAYDDIRSFAEREEVTGGIDPAIRGEIAAKEASTLEFIGLLTTAETGVGFLLVLAMVTTCVLAVGVLGRLASVRVPSAKADRLAGATDAVIAAPLVTAGAIAMVLSLAASVAIAGLLVAGLTAVPASSGVAAWMAHAAWTGVLPSSPAIIAVEAAVLVGLAHVVGTVGSRFRF